MYSKLFDETIGTAPPSTVDIDRVIAGERRRARRRRGGSVAGAVGAVALVSVVGLVLAGPAGPEVGLPFAPGASPTSPPSPTPGQVSYPPFAGASPTEDPGTAGVRLESAMRHALAAVAPGLVPQDIKGARAFEVRHTDTAVAGNGVMPSFEYGGAANLTVGGLTGMLNIVVSRAGVLRETCGSGDPYCATVNGSRGETGSMTTRYLNRDDAKQEVQYHLWLDRTSVDNEYVSVDLIVDGPAGATPQPLLTEAQLIKIAEDPGLTLYP